MTLVLALLLALQDDAAAQAEAAVAQFKTAYKNPDVNARVAAVGELGSAKSVDRLIGMWQTIDDYYHPHPTSDGKLESTKRTPEYDRKCGALEPEVRNAINSITRKAFGDLVAARTWWNANRATFKEQ